MNLSRETKIDITWQKGLTLVELMVAVTISMVLLSGVVAVYGNSKQTYRVQEALSRLQENGRYAIEFLSRDIRMADYWGCVGVTTQVVNGLDPMGNGYIDFTLGSGVRGTDGVTDTLVLQGAFGAGLTVQEPYGPTPSAQIKVLQNNILNDGDIVLVSDCVNGDIFQITNYNPENQAVVHNSGVDDPGPGNLDQDLSKVYRGDADIYMMRETIYTIADGESGQPALFRDVNRTGAVEIVEGVENMQIVYGEDTNGDGAPDAYRDAGAVVDMASVVSIRVVLTLRTLDDNVTLNAMNDSRLRRNFTTTVAIRNRLP